MPHHERPLAHARLRRPARRACGRDRNSPALSRCSPCCFSPGPPRCCRPAAATARRFPRIATWPPRSGPGAAPATPGRSSSWRRPGHRRTADRCAHASRPSVSAASMSPWMSASTHGGVQRACPQARRRRRLSGIPSTLASVSRPSVKWSRSSQNLNSAALSRRLHSALPVVTRWWMAARKLSCSATQRSQPRHFPLQRIAGRAGSSSASTSRYAACARCVAKASPLSSSRSLPYSRNVSSMVKRGSGSSDARWTSRLLSTSEVTPFQDVDAQVFARVADGLDGSSVQPPEKTERRRKSFCSAGVSRS